MSHKGAVYSAQFSPDGGRVVTASADKTARLWDASRGEAVGPPTHHESEIYSARFSPDGQSHAKIAEMEFLRPSDTRDLSLLRVGYC
jgi:WD40 repeat protein